MNKLSFLAAGLAVVALASVYPSPYEGIRELPVGGEIFESAHIDPATLNLFKRACQDCHSNQTAWPWYSTVAPASWLVERDVQRAREFLNLSNWTDYGPAQAGVLQIVRDRMNNASMPPARYVALHPEARLSNSERERIFLWIESELLRLGSTPAGISAQPPFDAPRSSQTP